MEGTSTAATAATAQTTPAPQPGNIVSAGKPVSGEFPIAPPTEEAVTSSQQNDGQATQTAGNDQQTQQTQSPAAEVPELTSEQIKALFAKNGIENFDGNFEELGKKLHPPQAAPEPTAEEKAAAKAEKEKNVLKFFLDHGGTAEQVVSVKQILSADPKEFSLSEAKRELKEAGFSESDIAEVMKIRYFQQSLEELEKDLDESDEDFKKRQDALSKKITFGTKKLESKGQYIRKQAEDLYSQMEQAYDAAQLLAADEVKFSSKVDEHFKTLPRKFTFELGESNGSKIDPVTFEVSEADVKEIQDTLKDPVKRQQFFFNEDNSLNLPNIAQKLLRDRVLEQALKVALLEGGTRQVAQFEKVFPGTPHALGVGGQKGGNNGRKGVIVAAGKPVPVARQS